MKVAAIRIGADPARWRELGFDVRGDRAVAGDVRLDLLPAAERGAIVSWALDGMHTPGSIDGLPTEPDTESSAQGEPHPNGVIGIDHVVVVTPSLERTTEAFAAIGVECRRVRDAAGGARQGFFIVGNVLVEVVDGTGLAPDAPARFWGITMVVSDIDAAAEVLGERLGRIKDAVQPGRRIATVRPEASESLPLALITPRA